VSRLGWLLNERDERPESLSPRLYERIVLESPLNDGLLLDSPRLNERELPESPRLNERDDMPESPRLYERELPESPRLNERELPESPRLNERDDPPLKERLSPPPPPRLNDRLSPPPERPPPSPPLRPRPSLRWASALLPAIRVVSTPTTKTWKNLPRFMGMPPGRPTQSSVQLAKAFGFWGLPQRPTIVRARHPLNKRAVAS
jgi:hypothetical protein